MQKSSINRYVYLLAFIVDIGSELKKAGGSFFYSGKLKIH